MTDQSYAAQVAADVAARYGVPVPKAAVQVVPRGVSSNPLPVWDGKQLVYAEQPRNAWRNQREASFRNRTVSPKAVERRLQVSELHAEGLHDAAIAAQLGVHQSLVVSDRKRLHLAANPNRTPEVGREQRNATVRAYIAQGWGAQAIAEEIGLAVSTVRDIARNVLNLPFAAIRKIKAEPKPKPPRLAKAGVSQATRIRVPKVKLPALPTPPSPAQLRLAALRAMVDGLGRDLMRADLDAYALREGRTISQVRRDIETLAIVWPRPLNWRRMATVRLSPIERRAVRDRRRTDIAAMDMTQVTVAELVKRFEVTNGTILRDLAVLGLRILPPPRGLSGAVKEAFENHRSKIAELHAKGADRAEIARETGLSRNAISRHLKGLGIDLPRGYVNPWANRARPGTTDRVKELQGQIIALRAEGKTYAEIMAATGLGKASVSRYLMELGLTGPHASQPHKVAA